jgi:hypothetical protein
MRQKEFYAILTRLRKEHSQDFERWYDSANYADIKDCCEIGFLLCRFYIDPFDKEETASKET